MIACLLARLRRDRRGATIIEFAIVAPVMMLLMMRGSHNLKATSTSDDEVAQLRAEVDQLRAVRSTNQRPTDAPNAS